ncbi:hypothetical protein [Mycetocola zhujimingii]|uniref:hypothetical protein n=1 Tax=Mycetocola zhujimingii TaxID=2079792 RepID=UPI0011B20D76|nr:hypothetical protein [Mycetocola zhujimingii]
MMSVSVAQIPRRSSPELSGRTISPITNQNPEASSKLPPNIGTSVPSPTKIEFTAASVPVDTVRHSGLLSFAASAGDGTVEAPSELAHPDSSAAKNAAAAIALAERRINPVRNIATPSSGGEQGRVWMHLLLDVDRPKGE